VKTQTADIASSPIPEHQRTGVHRLLFSDVLEDDFRRYYSQSSKSRARLLPSFTIMMTIISIVLRLSEQNIGTVAMALDILILLPLLVTTLYLSTQPDRYRLYQVLLAISGLLSGLVIISIAFRPTLMDMPSYFSMETTWIFAVWLILGLRFRVAALVTLSMSAVHIYGIFYIDPGIKQTGYEIVMLLLVNGIGAIACYHLEHAVRQAFLESREISALVSKLGKLAQLDGLTGLHNRRSYDDNIERIWNQSRRDQVSLAILLIDIDHFKAYNDHYGHQQGDDTLISVAKVIRTYERRPLDFSARYGGEEFILVLYGQNEQAGIKMAESLRKEIKALQIPHDKSLNNEHLTASIGVSIILPDTERSCMGAVQMADEALYQAKEKGRDCVVTKNTGKSALSTGKFRANQTATG
jgi:diguanylate cyclase (GGDEF)-like protein